MAYYSPEGIVCMDDIQFLIKDSVRGFSKIFPETVRSQNEFEVPIRVLFTDLAPNQTLAQ